MGNMALEVVETGERRDARGRRRMPQERREELVEAFKRSGATMAAFAAREGLNYTTFAGWVQRGQRARRRPAMQFAELKLPVATAPVGLEVRLPDGTVLRGGNAAELAALMRALRS